MKCVCEIVRHILKGVLLKGKRYMTVRRMNACTTTMYITLNVASTRANLQGRKTDHQENNLSWCTWSGVVNSGWHTGALFFGQKPVLYMPPADFDSKFEA